MNLEDRLRSHMHSGEDLFVEGDSTASDISAAGQRRTRRNQIAGGALAGFAALSLVFGATQLTGADDPADIAIDKVVTTDTVASSEGPASSEPSDMSELPEAEAQLDLPGEDGTGPSSIEDDSASSQFFDGPIAPFDVITGSFDGFVGVRTTGDVLTAITSDDGLAWEETATDLPEGLSITSVATNGLTLAGTFASFEESGPARNFIGTTVDLATWELVEVDIGAGYVNDLAVAGDTGTVASGTVIAVGFASPESNEESSEIVEDTSVVVIAEAGRPLEVIELEGAGSASNVASTEAGFVAGVFNDGAALMLSPDGRDWSAIDLSLRGDFVTPSKAGDDFIAVVQNRATVEVFRSSDLGDTWGTNELPPNLVGSQWWSVDVQSNEATSAILLMGDGGSALLVSNGPDLVEIDIAPFVPAGAPAILRGVSNDEVLLEVYAEPAQDAEDLAATSGIVDDAAANQPQAPTYVRVPIPNS